MAIILIGAVALPTNTVGVMVPVPMTAWNAPTNNLATSVMLPFRIAKAVALVMSVTLDILDR